MDTNENAVKPNYGEVDEAWLARIQQLRAETDSQRRLIHLSNFEAFVAVHHAEDWSEVKSWLALPGNWVYRGQHEATWFLTTSLERAITKTLTIPQIGLDSISGPARMDPAQNETKLLQEFQRRAHHYIKAVPEASEILDWLALMQHYGAPTRLLDWTLSPYVALYFAIERPSSGSEHAVWAIESNWLEAATRTILQEPFFPFNLRDRCEKINRTIFSGTNPNIVILANPFRMNERLAAQQGVFLTNLSHYDFTISLLEMIAPLDKPVVRKLVVSPSARLGLLRELQRMNITGASLFPGLDGFSQSLKVNLELELDALTRRIATNGREVY